MMARLPEGRVGELVALRHGTLHDDAVAGMLATPLAERETIA